MPGLASCLVNSCPEDSSSLSGGSIWTWRSWARSLDLLLAIRRGTDLLGCFGKDALWVSRFREQTFPQTSHLRSVAGQKNHGLPISLNTQCRKFIHEMGTRHWSQAARSARDLDEVSTPSCAMCLSCRRHFAPCREATGAATRLQVPRKMIYLLRRSRHSHSTSNINIWIIWYPQNLPFSSWFFTKNLKN